MGAVIDGDRGEGGGDEPGDGQVDGKDESRAAHVESELHHAILIIGGEELVNPHLRRTFP